MWEKLNDTSPREWDGVPLYNPDAAQRVCWACKAGPLGCMRNQALAPKPPRRARPSTLKPPLNTPPCELYGGPDYKTILVDPETAQLLRRLRHHFGRGPEGEIDQRTARRVENLRFIRPKAIQMTLDRVNQVLRYASCGDAYDAIFNQETLADFVGFWGPMMNKARTFKSDEAYQDAWLSLHYSSRAEMLSCLDYQKEAVYDRMHQEQTLHPGSSVEEVLSTLKSFPAAEGAVFEIALLSILKKIEGSRPHLAQIVGAIRKARLPLLRRQLLSEPATYVHLRGTFPLADWAGLTRTECRALEAAFLSEFRKDLWQSIQGKLAGCQFDLT